MSLFLLSEVMAASFYQSHKTLPEAAKPTDSFQEPEQEADFHLSDNVYDSDSFELAASEYTQLDPA